ncbi:MAG TPA: SPASM domain-containing protein [candidate division WOR-3 bacterium]|uniref:SPASM domain-containing protein n=1 Tax=candidate division WOR-3 bacterium TaxID=2052148 RepID=A0A9C9ELR2_UNCW3|nr:SPASM domain-containing protein [candidate division WOR-3 bacterium]
MYELKESRYNIWVVDYPSEKYSLVFNTLQNSLLMLPNTVRNKIKYDNINSISHKLLTALLELNILVEKEINELRVLKYWFERYRLLTDVVAISFLPTYSCNCACVYCYEEGINDRKVEDKHMSENLVADLMKWVTNLVTIWSPKTLDFCFHGGEPLLFPQILSSVAKEINQVAEKYALKKVFSVVTNGTLLSSKIVAMLKEYNFNKIMCTIDGIAKIHNSRRPFCNGKGTFQIIFNNIRNALDKGMTVIMSVNIDRINYSYIIDLIKFLSTKKMQKYDRFSVVFAVVKQGPQADNPTYFVKNQLHGKEIADIFTVLYSAALREKFRIVDPISSGFCSYRTMKNFFIDYKGDIYKCASLVGTKAGFIGNIRQSFSPIFRRLSQDFYPIPWEKEKRCKKCKYLPLCLGGCAQQSLLFNNNREKVDCMFSFFYNYLPEAIKIKYNRARLFPDTMDASSISVKEFLRL